MTVKQMKKYAVPVIAAAMCLGTGMSAFAGTWLSNAYGPGTWRYIDTNELAQSGWKWLDGNKDGLYECYYFEPDGRLAQGTTVDGYTVDADGAWTENGVIQRRSYPQWLSVSTVRQEGASLDFKYPSIKLSGNEAGAKAANDFVAKIVSSAEKMQEEALADAAADASAQITTTNNIDYDIVLSRNGRYAGVSVQNDFYGGGAHGLETEGYVTLTPEKGVLQIADIGGTELQNAITQSVRKTLKSRVDSGALMLFDSADKVNIDFSKNSWMLANDGLHVVFQEYEIAPYSEGIIDVCVPYSDIQSALNAYGRTLAE